jgi:hypothetical protein
VRRDRHEDGWDLGGPHSPLTRRDTAEKRAPRRGVGARGHCRWWS